MAIADQLRPDANPMMPTPNRRFVIAVSSFVMLGTLGASPKPATAYWGIIASVQGAGVMVGSGRFNIPQRGKDEGSNRQAVHSRRRHREGRRCGCSAGTGRIRYRWGGY